jgi:glucose-1-phosphate adenylyltransferase
MELIDIVPEFNLYEEFWKIYTNNVNIHPQYISGEASVERSIISNGSEIYGEVHNSVLSGGVIVGKGSVVRDSILMGNVVIGENCIIDRGIIDEDAVIEDDVVMGIGGDVPNRFKPDIYSGGLVTVSAGSYIPKGIKIGKNTVICGKTTLSDYNESVLEGGEALVKAGDN